MMGPSDVVYVEKRKRRENYARKQGIVIFYIVFVHLNENIKKGLLDKQV